MNTRITSFYCLTGARTGYRLGNNTVVDGLVHDGFWDVYNNQHMGMCGEVCADQYQYSREDQHEYALMSYERAANAWKGGLFNDEVAPIGVSTRKGQPDNMVTTNEEFTYIKIDKVKSLSAAFKKDGTVTAANASTINDGAAAMIVMYGKVAREQEANVLFKIRGFGKRNN